jgi:hypothetical protein
MLKYLLGFLVVGQLFMFANSNASQEEVSEEMLNTECEIVFDKCALKCDENSDNYAKCYEACEVLYESCIEKGAKSN